MDTEREEYLEHVNEAVVYVKCLDDNAPTNCPRPIIGNLSTNRGYYDSLQMWNCALKGTSI